MTFDQLYGLQLDIELASADRTQLFTTNRRKKAINDAMHNFERITSCTPIHGEFTITDGTAIFPLFASASNFLSLYGRTEPAIKITDAGGNVRWIQGENFARRSIAWLDLNEPGWSSAPKGTPKVWYLTEDSWLTQIGTQIGISPALAVPAGSTAKIQVWYLQKSDALVLDADVPFTLSTQQATHLEPYHQALVHYAAGLLEPLRKNYTAATHQMQLYAGYVAQYETKKRVDGPNQVTMRGNYFRSAQHPVRPVDPHRYP